MQISGQILERTNEHGKKEYCFEMAIVEDDMKTVLEGPHRFRQIFSTEREAFEAMDAKAHELAADAGLRLKTHTEVDPNGKVVKVTDLRKYDA